MIGRWQHPRIDKPDVFRQESWARWVQTRSDRVTLRPPLLARSAYDALELQDRADYDDARKIANSNLPVKDTPMAAGVGLAFQLLSTRNSFDGNPGVRMGMFLSGSSGGLGKSTFAMELAARFEENTRARADLFNPPEAHRDLWIPVVYVALPTNVTVKGLCKTILLFYGERPAPGLTEVELASLVRETVHDCGTLLIVIDDITRLRMEREAHQDTADAIRELQETGATILGVGIDIATSGLLFERGRKATARRRETPAQSTERKRAANLKTQTRRRFKLKSLHPFTYDADSDAAAWAAHLASVEEDLLLLDQQPGDLVDLAEYLFQRTQGFLGSLNELIGEACILAILTGQERLTEALLDNVELDEAAESQEEDPVDDIEEHVVKATQKQGARQRKKSGVWNGDNPANCGAA